MLRALALVALALTAACSGETRYVEAPDQDDTALREAAVEAWASVGVEAPSDYTLLFLDGETLLDACGWSAPPAGTALGGCTAASDVILLWNEADFALQRQVLTHELGHVLRGADDHRHLDCPESEGVRFPGHDVMCANPSPALPTERDAVFVTRK